MFLAVGSLYFMGAGGSLWRGLIAIVFGISSAISLGAFDAKVSLLLQSSRVIVYTAVACCIIAVMFDAGEDEYYGLSLAAVASSLMLVGSMVELSLTEPT